MSLSAQHSDTAASAASTMAKVATIWTGVAVGNMHLSFSDIAAILASLYSALLICDWVWRKLKAWRRRSNG